MNVIVSLLIYIKVMKSDKQHIYYTESPISNTLNEGGGVSSPIPDHYIWKKRGGNPSLDLQFTR